MNRYDLHPEVISDLEEIWEYIAESSVDAADKVSDQILDAIAALVPFPRQGHRRPDLTSRPLRFWRVYDYLIAYAPDDKPLWVGCGDAWSAQSACHSSDPSFERRIVVGHLPQITLRSQPKAKIWRILRSGIGGHWQITLRTQSALAFVGGYRI